MLRALGKRSRLPMWLMQSFWEAPRSSSNHLTFLSIIFTQVIIRWTKEEWMTKGKSSNHLTFLSIIFAKVIIRWTKEEWMTEGEDPLAKTGLLRWGNCGQSLRYKESRISWVSLLRGLRDRQMCGDCVSPKQSRNSMYRCVPMPFLFVPFVQGQQVCVGFFLCLSLTFTLLFLLLFSPHFTVLSATFPSWTVVLCTWPE